MDQLDRLGTVAGEHVGTTHSPLHSLEVTSTQDLPDDHSRGMSKKLSFRE